MKLIYRIDDQNRAESSLGEGNVRGCSMFVAAVRPVNE